MTAIMPMAKKHLTASPRTQLSEKDGELQLDGICLVAGLGNKEIAGRNL